MCSYENSCQIFFQTFQPAERGTSDRIERREESHESSRKRNHSPGESKNPQRNFSANKFTIAIRVGSNPLVRILVSVLKGYITIEKV